MNNTYSGSSQPQSDSNALAALRVGGLAQTIIDQKDDPAAVESNAREILNLVPEILDLLIEEGEKAPPI